MEQKFLDEEGLRKYNELLQAKLKLKAGSNIDITNNVVSVLTTDDVEEDNTKPITSTAVYTTVGNIKELLKTI